MKQALIGRRLRRSATWDQQIPQRPNIENVNNPQKQRLPLLPVAYAFLSLLFREKPAWAQPSQQCDVIVVTFTDARNLRRQ